MSGFTDFFQPTPTPSPRPVEPPGFDLLRDMLMRKIFAMQANPYGLSGQTAQNPMGGSNPFFSTGANMNAPALAQAGVNWGATSGGTPTQSFNPAYSQLGGVRHMDARNTQHMAHGQSPVPGQRVPLHVRSLQQMLHARHFDGGIPALTPREPANQMPGMPTMHHIQRTPAPSQPFNRIPVNRALPHEFPQAPGQDPLQSLIQHNANGGYGNWGGAGQTPAGGGFHPQMQDFHTLFNGSQNWSGWQPPAAGA